MLCHPDDNKSCANCCGLYNRAKLSRKDLEESLKVRTQQWKASGYDPDVYESTSPKDLGSYRYKVLQDCIYIGFVDTETRRVGCLLHEKLGVEGLRERCPYSKEVAEEFVCHAHAVLTTKDKLVLLSCVDDWFLYGLLIGDPYYVKKVIADVEYELAISIDVSMLTDEFIHKTLSERLQEKLVRVHRED